MLLAVLLTGASCAPARKPEPEPFVATVQDRDPHPLRSTDIVCRFPGAGITKRIRDGERYRAAGLLDLADREFRFAEEDLPSAGLPDQIGRDTLRLVQEARRGLRAERP